MKLTVNVLDVKINKKKTAVGIEFVEHIPKNELEKIIEAIKNETTVQLEFSYQVMKETKEIDETN